MSEDESASKDDVSESEDDESSDDVAVTAPPGPAFITACGGVGTPDGVASKTLSELEDDCDAMSEPKDEDDNDRRLGMSAALPTTSLPAADVERWRRLQGGCAHADWYLARRLARRFTSAETLTAALRRRWVRMARK